MIRRVGILAALAVAPVLIALIVFIGYVIDGVVEGANLPTGTLGGFAVRAPVTILRDERGIPHVRARNDHDLFFAEGYAQASDRLFQLDLYRRLESGTLCEVFGKQALPSDESARVVDVRAIAQRQLAQLGPQQRDALQAFSDGVNAAMRTRPLPPEFRALAYRPEPWQPVDSLVVSFATVLSLTDTWYDVKNRIDVLADAGPAAKDAFFSISDPAYDAPTTGRGHAPVAPLPALTVRFPRARSLFADTLDDRAGLGSNDFVAGAHLTSTHRALLGSDPHLELRIPGVWWLADLESPRRHVAGVTLAGVPGIVLGHNAHLAWGATNGTVTNVSVYDERFRSATSDLYLAGGSWLHAERRREVFRVRFARPVTAEYLRTRHGFVFEDLGVHKFAAAWKADLDRRSTLPQFDALDRAASAKEALAALAPYVAPAQNFVLADDAGNAAYVLAGEIPIDAAWGMSAHDGPSSGSSAFPTVPYAQMPHRDASPDTLAFTANARPYGAQYPYRLSASFSPPYRANEIERDLAHRPYDVAAFSAIQADVTSLPERDLAAAMVRACRRRCADADANVREDLAQLRGFDGRFTGSSRAAVIVTLLRRAATERLVRYHLSPAIGIAYLEDHEGSAFVALMRALRERPRGWVPGDDYSAFLVAALRDSIAAEGPTYGQRWADFGARTARHPLAALGLSLWNGVRFPGLGGSYSPHVQGPANAQSYRAVWDVGRWDRGGIVIPQGESGQPGSPHYRDLAARWIGGGLVPLPFSDDAARRAAVTSLILEP